MRFGSSGSEPPSSPQLVDEGVDEDDEELSGGEEAELRVSSGRGSVLTRRGITLRVLLKDGLVEPGDAVLSIHYLVLMCTQTSGFLCGFCLELSNLRSIISSPLMIFNMYSVNETAHLVISQFLPS